MTEQAGPASANVEAGMRTRDVVPDPRAPTFGLPESLRVPIAARSIDAIERHVGQVVETITGRDSGPRALLIRAPRPDPEGEVPLWGSAVADEAMRRLYPPLQVWVDVDYGQYRRAYKQFGLSIPDGYFLDHIQNRRVMRLRGRSHPWLRLSPVARRVNTSGGSRTGGEGMEYAYLTEVLPRGLSLGEHDVIYADPMDLTKMLDIVPGTRPLDGVRDMQQLFYPLWK